MSTFRRLQQRTKKRTPKVALTTIAELSTIVALPADVRASLGPEDQLLCVVNVDGADRNYTLLLDLEWVSMAVEVDDHPDGLTSGLPLPRAAIRAVINGWATDRPFDEPAARWSSDGIPHVGFALSESSDCV